MSARLHCSPNKVGSDVCSPGSLLSPNADDVMIKYIMVEAVDNCRLLPTSTLDIYEVFEHPLSKLVQILAILGHCQVQMMP